MLNNITYISLFKYFVGMGEDFVKCPQNKLKGVSIAAICLLIILHIVLPRGKSITEYYDEMYMRELAESMARELAKQKGKVGRDLQDALTHLGGVDEEEKHKQAIIKRVALSPGRDFEEGLFYLGENVIARQKIVNGKIVSQTGKIPDGKIKFYDKLARSYGEEFYRDGKIHGKAKTFFEAGNIKEESQYINGKLQKMKEYYNNGKLRFEVDYSNAREHKGQKEIGVGKLYYKNGTLRYEWSLTNSASKGYKKSYNKEGKLISSIYYDLEKESDTAD